MHQRSRQTRRIRECGILRRFVKVLVVPASAAATITAFGVPAARSASPALVVDELPLVFLQGGPVVGGVRVTVSTSDVREISVKANTETLVQEWTNNSTSSTATQSYKDVVTYAASEDFGAALGGKSVVSGHVNVGQKGSDTSTEVFSMVTNRTRREESRHELRTQLNRFVSESSKVNFGTSANGGYINTTLIAKNYSSHVATFSEVSDEIIAVNVDNGQQDIPFRTRSNLETQDVTSNPFPASSPSGSEKSVPLTLSVDAELSGTPQSSAKVVNVLGYDALATAQYFQQNKVFLERPTSYKLNWNGQDYSKAQVDQMVAAARDHDVEFRVIDEAGHDSLMFMKFVDDQTVTLVEALRLAGHTISLSADGTSIAEMDGRPSNRPTSLNPNEFAANLDKGRWEVLRQAKGAAAADLEPITAVGDTLVHPGELFVVTYVTLRSSLETQQLRSVVKFRKVNFPSESAFPRGIALWEVSSQTETEFPVSSASEPVCLAASETFNFEAGDHLHLTVKTAWQVVKASSRIVPPSFFSAQYAFPSKPREYLEHFIPSYKPTEFLAVPATPGPQVVGNVGNPNEIGLAVAVGMSAPRLMMTEALESGEGLFRQFQDGIKEFDFYVTAAFGEHVGPLCISFNDTFEAATIKVGNTFTPPVFSGGTAVPVPGIVMHALVDWRDRNPVHDASDIVRAQEWAVELTRYTRPWR